MIYDGIILGSGHNALVLACYAARAGMKVAVVEQNDTAGGGLATEEVPLGSGFKHNTHSFFHRGITAMPWYRELEVERYGVRYLEPELNVAMILPENRVLEWWTDFEKTFASFAAISPRDADRLREWTERFRPIVEQILIPEAQNAPLPPEERLAALKQTELGRTLLEVQALSPIEFVMREFEHPAVRAGLLFFNGLREVDLRQKGFGHSIPALLASPRKAQMCVGGSRRLAEALCADLREHGGVVFITRSAFA
ncbi:MAG TPA: NAD(P)-binding protein [Prosthecobacter sp.]|nr:NAD(P)-binding protein [Prosthecobacter sp.]